MNNLFCYQAIMKYFNYKKMFNILPYNKYFGLFVTILRNGNSVHGCIGYWEKDFKIIDNIYLNDKIIYSTDNALYSDNRRNNFNENIEYDVNAAIKVSLMLHNSISKINENGIIQNNGQKFNKTTTNHQKFS